MWPPMLRGLLTPEGQEALRVAMAEEPSEADFLPVYQRLSRRFPDHLAKAALEQAILRRKAREKFSSAHLMYFAAEALEQATPELVAVNRARRFAGFSPIFDLTCGLGGDALSLARVEPVVAVDRDPSRLALLTVNAEVLGLRDRIAPVLADVRMPAWRFPSGSGVFFDPSRRQAGRRIRTVDSYMPPLELLTEWLASIRAVAAKVGPGIDLTQVAHYDCEIEFVSVRGDLKEAVLWFGDLITARRRATVLPGPHSLTGTEEPDVPVGEPLAILYEPNPAVIRAGLVRTLGHLLHAQMLDRSIAYLTADRVAATPFATAYEVMEYLPFQLKRLRSRLRQMGVGPVTVKKRGSAIEPDVLIRKLGLRGEKPATVVLTRVLGKPYALIVRPLSGNLEQNLSSSLP